MFCKKCGAEIGSDFLCPSCGFQNVLSQEAEIELPTEDVNNLVNRSTLSTVKRSTVIIRNKLWAIFSAAMFVLAFIPLYKGYDKMTNYYSSDTYYSLNRNAYVGGDAYNYIINAGYATAFFVLAVGLALLGVGFLIVYYISGREE